jgi:hypothetical protein
MNRVFLVGVNANGGIALPFHSQHDAFETLQNLGIADRPAATFYAAGSALRIYPGGLIEDSNQVATFVQEPRPNFDLATLVDVIHDFHARCLVTPQLAGPGLWQDTSKWIPHEQAEKFIQWPLRGVLIQAFKPAVVVEEEKRSPVGNPDFIFLDANGRASPPLAVVEAKVPKTQRANGTVSPGVVAKELARGLIQTVGYRNVLSAPWGALICFDMRRPGAGQPGAWARAKARCEAVLKGFLRSGRGGAPNVITWQLFANSEAAQKASAVGPLFSTDPLYPVDKRAA